LYIENKSLSYEEGYIVAEQQPADELLGKGLRLAQHPPQIIPESAVDGVGGTSYQIRTRNTN
jgi:hypothetical protein